MRTSHGFPLADAWRGARDVHQAVFALLHGKEFVGILRLPVAANALAFSAFVLFGWLVLLPWFTACFLGSWWILDGLRASRVDAGPHLWLLCTWLLLGPALLDAIVGPAHESLRVATELRMLGPANRPDTRAGLLRLRDRVRILAIAAAALPLALLLVLLPYGLPIVLVLGAGSAAIVWFEAPMAVRGLGLAGRLRVLWQNRWRALGTGAGLQLAAAVPFVNVLALAGTAAVAATASYLHFEKRTVT